MKVTSLTSSFITCATYTSSFITCAMSSSCLFTMNISFYTFLFEVHVWWSTPGTRGCPQQVWTLRRGRKSATCRGGGIRRSWRGGRQSRPFRIHPFYSEEVWRESSCLWSFSLVDETCQLDRHRQSLGQFRSRIERLWRRSHVLIPGCGTEECDSLLSVDLERRLVRNVQIHLAFWWCVIVDEGDSWIFSLLFNLPQYCNF